MRLTLDEWVASFLSIDSHGTSFLHLVGCLVERASLIVICADLFFFPSPNQFTSVVLLSQTGKESERLVFPFMLLLAHFVVVKSCADRGRKYAGTLRFVIRYRAYFQCTRRLTAPATAPSFLS